MTTEVARTELDRTRLFAEPAFGLWALTRTAVTHGRRKLEDLARFVEAWTVTAPSIRLPEPGVGGVPHGDRRA